MKKSAIVSKLRIAGGVASCALLLQANTDGFAGAPLGTPITAQSDEIGLRGSNDIAQALLDHSLGLIDDADLQDRLTKGKEDRLATCFQILLTGKFHLMTPSGMDTKRRLTDWSRTALLQSLSNIRHDKLHKFLDSQRIQGVTLATRSTVIEILGAVGSGRDLQAMLVWSTPAEGRTPRDLRVLLQSSIEQILQNHPKALADIHDCYSSEHMSAVPSVLRAISATRTSESVRTMASLLGRIPQADSMVLTELGHMASQLQTVIPESANQYLLASLQSATSKTLKPAIQACARTSCTQAVPALIDLLASKDKETLRLTFDALAEITKEQLPRDAESWQTWYAADIAWFARDYARLVNDAKHGLPGHSAHALKELSKHRYFRERMVQDVIDCLQRPEEELGLLTLAVLGHLSSFESVPVLLQLLEEESNVRIRKGAFDALRRITKQNHGESADAWRSAGW